MSTHTLSLSAMARAHRCFLLHVFAFVANSEVCDGAISLRGRECE
jgi:hypothetical protein